MAAAATASLLSFSPLLSNPNPSNFSRRYKSPAAAIPTTRLLPCCYSHSQFQIKRTTTFLTTNNYRNHKFISFAASSSHDHPEHSDIEVEKEKNNAEREDNESQEAWKETLDTVKEEAKKMREKLQQAYEVNISKAMLAFEDREKMQKRSQELYDEYSKKAMQALKETAETLKIQADKAQYDLNIIAKEISEEGIVYISAAAENSPDSVKDVVETYASSIDVNDIYAIRDFHVGIPYGAILAVGGFLNFMLTGSISAIRFGVILGSALLALSIYSLRAWRSGRSSELFLQGQAGIAGAIFIRQLRLLCQRSSFSAFFMTSISGAAAAFFVSMILLNRGSKGDHSED